MATAKFNPAGTHIHKGFLKLRFDLYLEDPACKTYTRHYVPHFDRAPTEEELADPLRLALIPTHLELNPCLCHFITVPETIDLTSLDDYLKSLFSKATLATLDNYLVLPNSAHYISPLMRAKRPLTDQKIATQDIADLLMTVNERFNGLIVPLESDGKAYFTEPQSIDVGAAAINRASVISYKNIVIFGVENPANADGTLDTVEVWVNSNAAQTTFGTLYLVSGTTYSSRDHEYVGAITAGSKQTISGLSIDVATGDKLGINEAATGNNCYIERDLTGGGIFSASTSFPVSSVSFTLVLDRTISLYGTGTESGGGWTGLRHWKSTKSVSGPSIWVSEWELTDGDAARETAVQELIGLLPETIEEIT